MKRNILIVFIVAIVFHLVVVYDTVGQSTTSKHPNVVFIICDDLNDYEGVFGGHPQVKTPNIDKLAQSGISFTNAHSNCPVCAPSRNSLFTGVYPFVSGDFGWTALKDLPGLKNNKTIMELFAENGCHVMGSGKLLHHHRKDFWQEWGININNYGPVAFNGIEPVGHPSVPEPYRNIGPIDGSFAPLCDDLFAEESLGFIRKNKDNPFFLYLPFTIPHGKYQVPDDTPYSNENWTKKQKNYAAMITRMDKDIGRIFSLLDSLDLDENTIVFFASDNGGVKEISDFFESQSPFHGNKTDCYEGGIRSPLIVRWPGKIMAGSKSDHVSAFWDMMPTCCELAQTSMPENTDGISMLPELPGQKQLQHK
ncbi:MAG: sulfatase-like hydrolase/transferase [Draconibacterium sp.]